MVYTHKKRRNNQRPSLFVKRWIWVTNGAYHLPTHIKNTCMFNQPLYWAAIILPDIGWLSSELVKHLYRKNSKGHCKAVPQQGTATTPSTNPYQSSKIKKQKLEKGNHAADNSSTPDHHHQQHTTKTRPTSQRTWVATSTWYTHLTQTSTIHMQIQSWTRVRYMLQ